MAQIANTELTDTFDSWRNATNAVRHRINQFAVNESALYANTITANQAFSSPTIATFAGNTNVSGDFTLTYGGNFKQADANTTTTLRSTLAASGNTNISGDLLVTGNANFTEALDLQAGHLKIYSDSGSPSKIDFYCETNNAHYARLTAPFHADYSGSPTITLPTGTGTLALQADIGSYANNLSLINDRLQVANAASLYLSKTSTAAQSFAGAVTFNANVVFNATKIDAANTYFADGDKAIFGTGSDLEIYHNGSDGYIVDSGTGGLNIQASSLNIRNAAGTETGLTFIENGAVELYYDDAVKISTTTGGVNIAGIASYASANGAVETVTSQTGAVTPDFTSYTHFIWTLTGNITLQNPTTEKVGQSGVFVFTHSGGARTVSLGSEYESPGGTLALSAVNGYVDVVPYMVMAPGKILLGTSTKNLT